MLYTELKSPGSTKSRLRICRGQGRRGKTGGRGMKGQKARSGGAKRNFCGGQTPLFRQIPKMGFRSRKEYVTESVRLSELRLLKVDKDTLVTVDLLKEKNIIRKQTKYVKVFLSGDSQLASLTFGEGITLSKGVKQTLGIA